MGFIWGRFASGLESGQLTLLHAQFYFGKAVRQIVEGETRFSKIGAMSESASRAELAALDLKQLFLAMTEEVLATPHSASTSRLSL